MASNAFRYTAQEWEIIKPIFIRLYLEENKTLDQVRKDLAEKWNIVLSKKVCKSRITSWAVFKNYKACEKEALARHRDFNEQSDQHPLPVVLRGQPVKWDRVARHSKSRGSRRWRHEEHRSRQADSNQPADISLPASFRTLVDRNEVLLESARNYYAWNFHSWTRSERNGGPLYNDELFHSVCSALVYIRKPEQAHRGWRLLHMNCQKIHMDIATDSFGVLELLLAFGVWSRLGKASGLAEHMLYFIRNISERVLPRHHPFRNLLCHITNLETVRQIGHRMVVLASNGLLSHRNMFVDESWRDFALNLAIDLYSYDEGPETAQKFLSIIMDSAFVPIHKQLDVLVAIANSHFRIGNYNAAINQNIETLAMAREALKASCSPVIRMGLYLNITAIVILLAKNYACKGDDCSAIEICGSTFDESLKNLGLHHPRVVWQFKYWTQLLHRNGMWDELEMVRREYHFMSSTSEIPRDGPQSSSTIMCQ